jgi:protein-disulfide isomerase
MKASYLTGALAAALASASCNAQNGNDGGSAQPQSELPAVPKPADGDWSKSVIPTPEGGFLMGDPRAKVRLVEFASLTCPHCREFDETGVPQLIEKYVKTGQVAYELRNYVRDPFDLAATLVARCNGAQGFFPLTRAMFADQPKWVSRVQEAPQAQLEQLQALPPQRMPAEAAKLAGFPEWAAMRGVPAAKSAQCLSNQAEIDRLVQMNSDATTQFPNFSGTPNFVINGKLDEKIAGWPQLEAALRTALGERG